jgi:drug/metabolite transporter (DMT)-like permease
VPISAVLLGTLVLGETLSSSQWLGMAIIGLSLLMIDGRVFNRS